MSTFLSAEWRALLMLNYAVDPALLEPLLPQGVVLDSHDDTYWVSIVAFMFLDTRVKGIAVPGHRNFEELNLRFYVRRDVPDTTRGLDHRRGVAFVKEVVPRVAIASVARLLYNENYVSMPMRHQLRRGDMPLDSRQALEAGDHVSYGVQSATGEWGRVSAHVKGPPKALEAGSHAQFIAEHYWGYARQNNGGTVEYEVHHPPWKVHAVENARFEGDAVELYGTALGAAIAGPPRTAFIAVGSAVEVGDGESLPRLGQANESTALA